MTTILNLPPLYVADAHTLLWRISDDKRLSKTAGAALDRVDNGEATLVIPAVALAEVFMTLEKGRIVWVKQTRNEVVEGWQNANNIRLTALTAEIVIESLTLIMIPEIFDRLIAAEAKMLNAPLITKDPEIIASGLVTVVW